MADVGMSASRLVSAAVGVAAALCGSGEGALAAHVPACSFQEGPGALDAIANGRAAPDMNQDRAGDCFMLQQQAALRDKIVLDACPSEVRLIKERAEAFARFVALPTAQRESDYGRRFAADRDALKERTARLGCAAGVKAHFPSFSDTTTFLELAR